MWNAIWQIDLKLQCEVRVGGALLPNFFVISQNHKSYCLLTSGKVDHKEDFEKNTPDWHVPLTENQFMLDVPGYPPCGSHIWVGECKWCKFILPHPLSWLYTCQRVLVAFRNGHLCHLGVLIYTSCSILHWSITILSNIPQSDRDNIAKASTKELWLLLLESRTDYLVTITVLSLPCERYGNPYSRPHTYLPCVHGAASGIHPALNELILPIQTCTIMASWYVCHHSTQVWDCRQAGFVEYFVGILTGYSATFSDRS